jgi:2-polyprenyl-3-methyl-5-hydroxy-6-metoxy-1,4-benzoquinol methylase
VNLETAPASVDPKAAYQAARLAHWDAVAHQTDEHRRWSGAYYRRLTHVYKSLASSGRRVLEIGSGLGDIVGALGTPNAVGVDFSPEMVRRAQQKYPGTTFIQADAHALDKLEGPFDLIILSDLVNDVWDVQTVFEQVARLSTRRTRIALNFYSRLWEPALGLAGKMHLARPVLPQNWFTVADVVNLLQLAGFEVIRRWEEVLWPIETPLINPLCNRYLVKMWPFRSLALTNFVLARLQPKRASATPPRVTVVVPARNEAGNIPQVFTRVPEMGSGTEIMFVEGHSSDDTWATIQREVAAHPERRCQMFQQTGKGKGDAVRLGYAHATGDILMILDADLTVPPEDLPRFFEAIYEGRGEFINGVRLVYPMEGEAMRFFNLIGNKFFSLAFSWLVGQPIKDTLCGTKVLWKEDYELVAANRKYFGDFDPFGDFDLLFGAARLGLRIVDLPVRYRARTYGETNIQRWSHGWLLLQMVVFAARRLKFA